MESREECPGINLFFDQASEIIEQFLSRLKK